jgi:hypothetical protein
MVGVIYRDPVKANHWHISNGTDDFEIAFASTIDRGDIPEFAKAGPVIVTGLLSHDESGRRTGISEVNGCYTFPAVKFHRIIVPERDIILLNPAIGVPSYDAQSKAWHLECDLLGIDVSKPSWDECVIAFHDYFAFLWETYCESDDEFEGEEKEIRDYLKSLEPMV